jgi:hypothetical protein
VRRAPARRFAHGRSPLPPRRFGSAGCGAIRHRRRRTALPMPAAPAPTPDWPRPSAPPHPDPACRRAPAVAVRPPSRKTAPPSLFRHRSSPGGGPTGRGRADLVRGQPVAQVVLLEPDSGEDPVQVADVERVRGEVAVQRRAGVPPVVQPGGQRGVENVVDAEPAGAEQRGEDGREGRATAWLCGSSCSTISRQKLTSQIRWACRWSSSARAASPARPYASLRRPGSARRRRTGGVDHARRTVRPDDAAVPTGGPAARRGRAGSPDR